MSRYLYPFLQTLWPNHFPLQLSPSSPRCIFIGVFEKLASQNKAEMKNLFLDIQTTLKIKLVSIMEKLTQRQMRWEQVRSGMNRDDCENEICASTQFLQIQKNQLMNCRSIWNDIVRYYLCLASTLQNKILILSSPVCYPFSLTNEILNPLSSRNQTSSSRSKLVIFSYWI